MIDLISNLLCSLFFAMSKITILCSMGADFALNLPVFPKLTEELSKVEEKLKLAENLIETKVFF